VRARIVNYRRQAPCLPAPPPHFQRHHVMTPSPKKSSASFTPQTCPHNPGPRPHPTPPHPTRRHQARGDRHPHLQLQHLLPHALACVHAHQQVQIPSGHPGLPPGWHGLQHRRRCHRAREGHARGESGPPARGGMRASAAEAVRSYEGAGYGDCEWSEQGALHTRGTRTMRLAPALRPAALALLLAPRVAALSPLPRRPTASPVPAKPPTHPPPPLLTPRRTPTASRCLCRPRRPPTATTPAQTRTTSCPTPSSAPAARP
jgi:hypothetical protein